MGNASGKFVVNKQKAATEEAATGKTVETNVKENGSAENPQVVTDTIEDAGANGEVKAEEAKPAENGEPVKTDDGTVETTGTAVEGAGDATNTDTTTTVTEATTKKKTKTSISSWFKKNTKSSNKPPKSSKKGKEESKKKGEDEGEATGGDEEVAEEQKESTENPESQPQAVTEQSENATHTSDSAEKAPVESTEETPTTNDDGGEVGPSETTCEE